MKHSLLCSTAISVLLVTGCAVGPDFKAPAAPAVKEYTEGALPGATAATAGTQGAAQTFAADKTIPADWWKLFECEPLNRLVDEALHSNPDLQAAKASLRQAQENVAVQTGELFPQVDAAGNVTREKLSGAAFGQPSFPSSLFTLYNASVSVSYGIDIFGGERRAIESLQAQADAQRYELQAAYLTLTTNVVTAAIREATLNEQINETQHILAIENKELDVLNKQLKVGGIPRSTVLAQETIIAQTQTTLPSLLKQLAQTRHQLAALTGHFASEPQEQPIDLAQIHLPESLPVSLPSTLVNQRPDIRIAEADLHTASANVGVATANMLPKLTLSGSYGTDALRTQDIFSSGAEIWSIGGGLTQPIFHGGELLHQKRASVAAYDKAAAQYKSTVLSAFENVADTLRALQYDADALAAQAKATEVAKNNFDLTHVQFDAGAVSYPQLLDAENSYEQSQIALVQARGARLADTAALFDALGGGWIDPAAAPASAASAPSSSQTLSVSEPKS